MIKIIFALAIILPTLSLNAASHHGVHTTLKFSQYSEELSEQVPSKQLRFVEEDIHFFEGPQKVKFEKALAIIEEVMNSEAFKHKVIGFIDSRNERKYNKNYLWDNSDKRLTNEDIYNVIMDGNEKMRPNTLGEMNFNSWVKECTLWQTARNPIWCFQVIGSTEPHSSHWITLNWNFYQNFETHEMVANMVHEWIHLLGFIHGESNLEEEVPYVVGKIAGEVAKNLLEQNNYIH